MLALGHEAGGRVVLASLKKIESLQAFGQWLGEPREWVGGFDFPFGLPRELVEHLGWPLRWRDCMAHYAQLTRADIRSTFARFCDARPAGGKFAHRAFDKLAGSSPSMKWVNPPVAYMLHAAVPLLLEAGVHIPGLHPGDERRVALEAYPGLLARELIGRRSYKSDDKARQTADRLIARKDLITALENGRTRLGLRLKLTNAQHDALVAGRQRRQPGRGAVPGAGGLGQRAGTAALRPAGGTRCPGGLDHHGLSVAASCWAGGCSCAISRWNTSRASASVR